MQSQLEKQIMIIQHFLKKPENKRCADCKRKNPILADIKIGVFLCEKCAKIHKEELKNISIIKTINNDLWSYETLEYFSKLNNIISNSYWEFKLTNVNYNQILEDDNLLKNFIINKYYGKIWINLDLPDPMTLVINGHDLISEYAKAGFPPLNEEDDYIDNNKFGSVSKENYIKEKIFDNNYNNINNNVKLVDFEEEKKKGFQFIKKKNQGEIYNFTNNYNNNNTGINFVNDKNINNGNFNFNINNNNSNLINFENNQVNSNEKNDGNLVDLFNVETKETQAFNFLSQNLQNAYKDQGNNKEKEQQQEKNFQFIMGMKNNDMLNNQNNSFNYNLVNSNINNNQKKKDDPFSNLVNF